MRKVTASSSLHTDVSVSSDSTFKTHRQQSSGGFVYFTVCLFGHRIRRTTNQTTNVFDHILGRKKDVALQWITCFSSCCSGWMLELLCAECLCSLFSHSLVEAPVTSRYCQWHQEHKLKQLCGDFRQSWSPVSLERRSVQFASSASPLCFHYSAWTTWIKESGSLQYPLPAGSTETQTSRLEWPLNFHQKYKITLRKGD